MSNQPNESEEAARMQAASEDPYQHPKPQPWPASMAGDAKPLPPGVGYLNLAAPPTPRYLDIPLGTDANRLLASVPFGISEADYDLILATMTLWRERLTQKP